MTTPTVKTPVGSAPIIPLAMLGIGAYLGWYAIHYWKQGGWPTTPVKSVLQGKGLPSNANKPQTAAAVLAADIQAGGNIPLTPAELSSATGISQTGGTSGGPGGGVGAQGGTAAQNQNIAKMLAHKYGWDTGANWDALVKLWNQESSWSNTAKNPTSGAYGIAQALPPTKYPAAGQAPPVGTSNASVQISWGLQYISQRYGSPTAAWAHEQQFNWY